MDTNWLARIFGCHCLPNRSFYFRQKQFPICARCTGELIGILVGIISFPFVHFSILFLILLLLPLIFDGFLQLLTTYESKNVRRCITGILFGYAFSQLIIMSMVYVYLLGYNHAR
ncbi:DUF2085 domain-containing protein [Enterococcus plantarum]|uniref:DUF2085 domain-containing protein n=1 Tax=unclassified Enterococcus TaxID=2608891 RepID=UPI0009F19805